ncbi:MAG: DUF4157 domain-containing protein [Micropruina sp.]|uniref:eCIS core domain-containing protein n=1 Tax=Micropruina sp. TaxID=2737536 RepID=UPI0039E4C84D
MHDHLTDERIATLRPKGARIDGDAEAMAGKAAGHGRPDVLDPDAIFGLQRSAGNGAVVQLMEDERSPVHDVVNSGGRPMEPDVREDMEARLGHDFSDVRIHDDAAAADSAKAVNAHAYTVGSNVVFQRNAYDPSSTEGKTTLAHELTHVIQQRSGPVDGTSAPGGIKVSDPSDRFEREASANADRVMAGPAPVQALSASAPAVQREEAEEEEVQGSFVQREEEKEEEEPVQGLFVQRAEDEDDEEAPA